MFYFIHKSRILTTVMQVGSLEPVYDIYSHKYLCTVVQCEKICFLLHAYKFRMTRMYVEKKWIDMHGNKKSD
jgi:hypothetical protein